MPVIRGIIGTGHSGVSAGSAVAQAKAGTPRRIRTAGVLLLAAFLAACARQAPSVVESGAPGFLHGLFHGWIILFSFIGSLFTDVSIYAVPNNGFWYNLGFALGVGAFSGGAAAGSRRR